MDGNVEVDDVVIVLVDEIDFLDFEIIQQCQII